MSPEAPVPDFGSDSAGLMSRIDTTKAHPAPVYDVFLGGTDNFPADREAAAMALAANPLGHLDVRHNRDARVVSSVARKG
ncbi:SLT domain-containing protein [Streptomyces atratus]